MKQSLLLSKLGAYFSRLTGVLPQQLASQDSYRLLILLFSELGLDVLHQKEKISSEDLLSWVYLYYMPPEKSKKDGAGFRSLIYTGVTSSGTKIQFPEEMSSYDSSHVTIVYSALCILLTLGDDLSRVDRRSVLSGIAALQCHDIPGLFYASLLCSERDIRFVFSAVASCYILDGLDVIDEEAVVKFIGQCMTHDGGFGCLPGLESHAGATYCALASLALFNRLNTFLPPNSRTRLRLIKWLISLQTEGFHGRTGKDDDSCYTFWVCASLKLLGCANLVDRNAAIRFVSRCWDSAVGGIRKHPFEDYPSDPLHSALALSGLSCLKRTDATVCDGLTPQLLAEPDTADACNPEGTFQELVDQHLSVVRPELNISERTYEFLQQLHVSWRRNRDS